ncbi:hypothetical protein [Tautonia sociabilis]|uniref:Uncharacterized protein n=1 Tax=Tautonia sociabilis TaxID=2080755 RepID=A0A432MDX5_9BACT|nr:hypothetical protein [Tautonia sociabilis]RUL83193.1 hypothetical protein TsocGM_22625 [Tautonia sociabilis]
MTLSVAIGGAKGTFADRVGAEVARILDHTFGAEGEWEGVAARRFGELTPDVLAELLRRAVVELGADALPNLSALVGPGTAAFLPAHVQAVTLPLSDGGPLRCASLPGLRDELAALAERWELPLDDAALLDLLRVAEDPVDGPVSEPPEVLTFARLALAANEAVRRDCPLWLLG